MSDAVPPTPPADRYGRRRPTAAHGDAELEPDGGPARSRLSGRAKVAIALGLALGVALAAWLSFAQYQRSPVTADVVSFRVTSAEQIEIDFQVSMPVGTKAVCTVEALSKSFAQVGTMQVPVGPSKTATTRYSVTLRTSQRADAGTVNGCVPA
jgi:hypothetical protein